MAREVLQSPRFQDLSLGAQLLLWATRHWMRAHRQRRMISACVPRSFAESGLLPAYAALCEMLAILAFREYPPSEFAHTNAPRLSAAEMRFLGFLIAVDRDDAESVRCLLPVSAVPAITRQLTNSATCLLRCLHDEGHRLVAPMFVSGATSCPDLLNLPATNQLCRRLC